MFPALSTLVGILRENDSRIYEECFLAIRRKAVDMEDKHSGFSPLTNVATAIEEVESGLNPSSEGVHSHGNEK